MKKSSLIMFAIIFLILNIMTFAQEGDTVEDLNPEEIEGDGNVEVAEGIKIEVKGCTKTTCKIVGGVLEVTLPAEIKKVPEGTPVKYNGLKYDGAESCDNTGCKTGSDGKVTTTDGTVFPVGDAENVVVENGVIKGKCKQSPGCPHCQICSVGGPPSVPMVGSNTCFRYDTNADPKKLTICGGLGTPPEGYTGTIIAGESEIVDGKKTSGSISIDGFGTISRDKSCVQNPEAEGCENSGEVTFLGDGDFKVGAKTIILSPIIGDKYTFPKETLVKPKSGCDMTITEPSCLGFSKNQPCGPPGNAGSQTCNYITVTGEVQIFSFLSNPREGPKPYDSIKTNPSGEGISYTDGEHTIRFTEDRLSCSGGDCSVFGFKSMEIFWDDGKIKDGFWVDPGTGNIECIKCPLGQQAVGYGSKRMPPPKLTPSATSFFSFIGNAWNWITGRDTDTPQETTTARPFGVICTNVVGEHIKQYNLLEKSVSIPLAHGGKVKIVGVYDLPVKFMNSRAQEVEGIAMLGSDGKIYYIEVRVDEEVKAEGETRKIPLLYLYEMDEANPGMPKSLGLAGEVEEGRYKGTRLMDELYDQLDDNNREKLYNLLRYKDIEHFTGSEPTTGVSSSDFERGNSIVVYYRSDKAGRRIPVTGLQNEIEEGCPWDTCEKKWKFVSVITDETQGLKTYILYPDPDAPQGYYMVEVSTHTGLQESDFLTERTVKRRGKTITVFDVDERKLRSSQCDCSVADPEEVAEYIEPRGLKKKRTYNALVTPRTDEEGIDIINELEEKQDENLKYDKKHEFPQFKTRVASGDSPEKYICGVGAVSLRGDAEDAIRQCRVGWLVQGIDYGLEIQYKKAFNNDGAPIWQARECIVYKGVSPCGLRCCIAKRDENRKLMMSGGDIAYTDTKDNPGWINCGKTDTPITNPRCIPQDDG